MYPFYWTKKHPVKGVLSCTTLMNSNYIVSKSIVKDDIRRHQKVCQKKVFKVKSDFGTDLQTLVGTMLSNIKAAVGNFQLMINLIL